MKKWKKVIIILLCIAVVLAIAGYAAYNIAFNFVQDKMIETMLDSMLDSGDVSVEELELMAEVTLPEEGEPAPSESAEEVSSAPSSVAASDEKSAETPAKPASEKISFTISFLKISSPEKCSKSLFCGCISDLLLDSHWKEATIIFIVNPLFPLFLS